VGPTRIPPPVTAAFAVLAAALVLYVGMLAGSFASTAAENAVYLTLLGGAGALCLARAFVGRDRLVWGLLAAGLLAWIAGEAYWNVAGPAGASLADAGYLGFYVFALPATVLLLSRRASGTLATLWADGWVAALTVASVATFVFVEPVIAGTGGGDLGELLANLAYPVGDTVLLAFVVGAAVATRGRMRGSWLGLSASLAVMSICDGIYLNLVWSGGYTDGTLLDAGWPAAALGMSWAAWTTYTERARRRPLAERAPIVWPVLWGAGSLTIVAAPALGSDTHPIPTVLAVAGIASVLGRLMLTDAQNRRLAEASSLQAITDPVTGLGNRRALMTDLEEALATAPAGTRVLVAIYDLDGFKAYNDTFGHPAGDALLARLGGRLRAAVGEAGRAYRMGGDEFCVVAVVDAGAAQEFLLARAARALAEHGDAFTVSAAGGHVLADPARTTASSALSAADERMYAAKRGSRASSLQQTSAVLAAALRERRPRAADGAGRLARLAQATARNLGMDEEDACHVGHAAALHDIGKLAIPDAILAKPGPLDADELGFVRTHTLAGERITAAAPALAPVAKLIRASHERYDGAGYPDGLAGEEILLGARIVFVCDAFDAMTGPRAHRAPLSDADALAELRANAGAQFDPAVVRAFGAALAHEGRIGALAA